MQVRNILFPVDFSERSREAVPYVRAMADRFGAAVTLLNVVERPVTWYGTTDVVFVSEYEWPRLKEYAEEHLRGFAKVEFAGMPVTRIIEEGDPGICIADLVEARKFDLVMMPSHGHGAFRVALLGSTTAKVLHDVACPVWTSAHRPEAGPEHADWRTIMCAIDLVPESVRTIRAVADLAAQCNSKVYLVHCVPATDSRPEKYYDQEFVLFLKDFAREEIAKLQKEAGTDFNVCLEAGSIPQVVHDAAVHHNADLVMIGRGKAQRFAGRLRTHSYSIIRESPCPVLSI